MGGVNCSYVTYASVEVFDLSMSSLYPINDNYVKMEGGYHSPKSLENLCIDQVCRSLPDLDREIPPKYRQDVINTILESLVSRGALTFIPLEVFNHYDLGQLTTVDKRLPSLLESISKVKPFKRVMLKKILK